MMKLIVILGLFGSVIAKTAPFTEMSCQEDVEMMSYNLKVFCGFEKEKKTHELAME